MTPTLPRTSLCLIGCALVSFFGCVTEAIDPDVESKQAAQRSAAVVRAAAEAAKGNRGAERALDDLGQGFESASRAVEPLPTNPTSVRGDSTPTQPPPAQPPPPRMKEDPRGGRSPVRRLLEVGRLLGGFRTANATGSAAGAALPAPDGLLFAEEPREPASDLADDLDQLANDLEKAISERILAPANLESKTDEEAIYLLKPDPTCRDVQTNGLDEDCAETLGKLQVRVRMTLDGDGIKLDVLFGKERVRPATIYVRDGEIALDVYLDGVRQTIIIEARDLGERADDVPVAMNGTIRFSIKKENARKVSVNIGFPQMIDIQNTAPTVDPDERFVLKSAKADHVLSLSADGAAGVITGGVGLGTTEVIVPWRPNDEPPTTTRGELRVVVGGLTGQTQWTQGRDELRLTGLGLGGGPSFAEVRGQKFVQIDLNPSNMRAFDATIAFGPDRMPRFNLTPRFDLSMMWNLAAIAGDFREPPPPYLLDETYKVAFDAAGGMTPAFEPFDTAAKDVPVAPGAPPPPPSTAPTSGLRVVAGKLSFSSTKAPSPIVVNAGQCLWSASAAPGTHPVLGALRVGACP